MKKINLIAVTAFLFSASFFISCSKENVNADTAGIQGQNGNRGETGNIIHILPGQFNPRIMQVIAGSTVTWVNNDQAVHSVTADNESFASGDILPGQSYSRIITEAGTFTYHCNYNPSMVGTLQVTGIR